MSLHRSGHRLHISVGVVGAGYIADFAHLPVLARNPDVRVVAICDENLDKARTLARKYAVPSAYPDLGQMLEHETLDLLDVSTPPHRHYETILPTLARDIPCLVEKPLTVSTADADEIIALAQDRSVPLFVLHTFSALPAIRQAKQLIQAGAIGSVVGVEITYLTPFAARHLSPDHWCHRLPGDYFSEAGPHLAMLLVDFLGPPRDVKTLALKRSHHPSVRFDEFRILVETDQGAGTITCSLNCPARMLIVGVIGTAGALHIDGNTQAVVRYPPIQSSGHIWSRGGAAVADVAARGAALTKTAVGVLFGRYPPEIYGHMYLVQHCLQHLRTGSGYPVNVNDAREAVRLLELAFPEPVARLQRA